MTVAPQLFSRAAQDWNTPEVVLTRVRTVGPIAFDPCANASSIVGAHTSFDGSTPELDGLAASWLKWSLGGLCFINPPYDAIAPWVVKAAEEGAQGCEIILLAPARTDTHWWRPLLDADEICFWHQRIKFSGGHAGAPFPSAIAYWGDRAKVFRAAFQGAGWFRFGGPR